MSNKVTKEGKIAVIQRCFERYCETGLGNAFARVGLKAFGAFRFNRYVYSGVLDDLNLSSAECDSIKTKIFKHYVLTGNPKRVVLFS